MVYLSESSFLMGTEDKEGFLLDGEGPIREVSISPFYIDTTPVTNRMFKRFIEKTGYITESEKYGWSFVFQNHITQKSRDENLVRVVPVLQWWSGVLGSSWQRPEGPGSSLLEREDHPVVQISWNDANAYSQWEGKRLATEAEWEYAARGGLIGKKYVWGDELLSDEKHMCNIWQGNFPENDTAEDGYAGTCPMESPLRMDMGCIPCPGMSGNSALTGSAPSLAHS
jgi:sulfatase modifying factor 1